MDSSETREYLKRQVSHAPGDSQEQRERFYILELVYGLHGKINRLEKPRRRDMPWEWVAVDKDHPENLPPPHTHFLALNRDGRVFESCMCYGMHEPWFTYPYGDGSASNTAPDWIDVTHWMPKPELPT